jgi:two-component sensor histidine kinase
MMNESSHIEVSKVFSVISKYFTLLEEYVTFHVPFAIISDSHDIIFKSSYFCKLENSRITSENTILDLIPDMRNDYTSSPQGTTYRKIATTKNGIDIFCLSIGTSDNDGDRKAIRTIPRFYHDSQEPLRNIANFLQMIKLQLLPNYDKDVMNYVDFSLENVETLSNWHKKLLGEAVEHSNRVFKIHEAIEHIQRLISSQISQRGCVIQCDTNIPPVNGEYFEILRVFKNLIENSIKHANSDELIINISDSGVSSRFVRIIFRDNGSNLPKNVRDKIGSILNGKTRSIGLEICRDILISNNGTIKFLENNNDCSYEIMLPVGIQSDEVDDEE